MSEISLILKALSDPTRRRILELLKEKDLTAGEIAENFPMGMPTISHHLNLLKTAGLVLAEREGQYILYSLNTTVFQEILSWIYTILAKEKSHERKRKRK
ncbi:MAG: autorepressor SdpR family transcription factor [Spirochaetales bacterium]